MKIFMSAGESSGDALGAALIERLRDKQPELEIFGMGGERMVRAGFDKLEDSSALGVVGLVEVLRHLLRLFALAKELAEKAISRRPDVAVLIDVPDFNIRVAKRLTRAGIPCIFYVGPSVWAWRPGRVKRYRPYVHKMMVLFPFETEIWRAGGVDAVCVGHPLRDEIAVPAALGASEEQTLALLPGSRRSEIDRHLDAMLSAADILRSQGAARRFVLPVAPGLDPRLIESRIEGAGLSDVVDLVGSDPEARRAAIGRSSVALVASGTATLETALLGRPQVIVYRVHWLSYLIGRLLARVRHLGLVNLILNREVAPELLQGAVSPQRIADEARARLGREALEDAQKTVSEIHDRLGPTGAAERAAQVVLGVLEERRASA